MRETLLFFDRPAEEAIAAASHFLEERGVRITHRTPYSVAFEGAGQFAAVPVQLKPQWCRLWVTVTGDATAADAFVTLHRTASRRVQQAVQLLESSVYDEARWPAYEAQLRASLATQGTDQATMDAKVAAFKQRWLALGRKAAAAPPEEPETA